MKKNRHHNLTRRSGRFIILAFTAIIVVSLAVFSGCYLFYVRYRDSIIRSEEKQLQTIADTIGQNVGDFIMANLGEIDLFYDEIVSERVQTEPDDGLQRKISAFLNREHDLYSGLILRRENGPVLYFDRNGEAVSQKDANPDLRSFAESKNGLSGDFSDTDELSKAASDPDSQAEEAAAAGRKNKPEIEAEIVGKRQISSGQGYHMYIRKYFFYGNERCSVLLAMDLNEIYRRIVAPVRIGTGGYSIVKDQDLTILMHHAKSQIGLDAISDRARIYPNLNLSDLEKWITYQTEHDSGSQVLHTYDWDQDPPQDITRVIAFTTIRFRGEQWIINSTLPLEELQEPLNSMISMLTRILTIYVLLVLIVMYLIIRITYQARSQEDKIHYLQEINRGMETIVQKNEEIRHYQRIQSLGMMSSHIAHEFNNYLTPVLLYADMLQNDETLSEDGKEMVREISSSIDRASDLSRQLLEFSRQDTGIRLSELNLTEEVQTASNLIRQLCPARITFIADITDENIFCLIRKGMVEQILMNLAKNAFQAMEETKQPILCIQFGRNNGGQPLLFVKDNGCGIPEQSLSRIFDPFYTTKGSREGTGLGLSVIQNILNSIHGSIRVYSKVGEGTEFRIEIPEITENRGVGGRKRLNSIKNVGIVSPDPKIRQYRDFFHLPDMSVSVFEQSAPVLDRITKDPNCFDLMLIDYQLPAMSGIDLAEIIRRQNPEIRLIVLVETMDPNLGWYQNNGIIDRFVIRDELAGELKILYAKGDHPESGDAESEEMNLDR
ncbi:ATP-binding protein [[Clostridium] aminophilum]|uniref:ATP-binding protein n=1 Tax=[Clostridium] aminophilum TaxID=1526 RepID=UPI003322731E